MALALGWRLLANSPALHFALIGPPPHPVSVVPDDEGWNRAGEPSPSMNQPWDEEEEVFVVDPDGIWVQIVGCVQQPGVYRVAPGTRLFMLLAHAGGITTDGSADGFNLTAEVSDGQMVVIPGAETAGEIVDDRININTASSEELQQLSGIGPVLAGRIIDHRGRWGIFSSVEELLDVSGIGPSSLENLRDRVRVR